MPYPTYKDSGVEWLGDVPAHWRVAPVKRHFAIRLGKMLQPARRASEDCRVSYLKAKHVQWFEIRTNDIETMWATPAGVERYGVVAGDLLVCEGGEGGRCGLVEHGTTLPDPCIIQNALHRVRPRRRRSGGDIGRNDYLQYLMSTIASLGWFDVLTDKATIAHLTGEKFGALPAPAPPLREQVAIVRFLDRADRRIRRYIHAKEKLIALLEEQKQAIIHEAVTGRIDVRTGRPYPAYRDSGVEWLGSAPEHWGRRRLKTVLRPVDQRSVDGSETLLSLRRDHGVVSYAEHFSWPAQADSLVGFKRVVPGQLVVNRLQANNGLIFCSALGGLVSPDYSVFERRAAVQTRYLSDLLRTSPYRAHFRRQSTGLGTGTAGFLRVYDDDLLATPVALPSSAEQAAIVAYVERVVADVATLAARAGRQVDVIREYRTRLIADIVTGKVDVREAAARLPEVDFLGDDGGSKGNDAASDVSRLGAETVAIGAGDGQWVGSGSGRAEGRGAQG